MTPSRTSLGGPKGEGAKSVLVPLVIDTVKWIINDEMEDVVEELKESADAITEQSVLGVVIAEVQGRSGTPRQRSMTS